MCKTVHVDATVGVSQSGQVRGLQLTAAYPTGRTTITRAPICRALDKTSFIVSLVTYHAALSLNYKVVMPLLLIPLDRYFTTT
jgi:hypothetical protein